MAYNEWNGHVIDDVTSLKWPWKVKVAISIRLGPKLSRKQLEVLFI